jgi:hypothetical protein
MVTAAPRPSFSSFPIEAGLHCRPRVRHGRAPLYGRPSDGEQGQAEGEAGSSSTRRKEGEEWQSAAIKVLRPWSGSIIRPRCTSSSCAT